jgi:predicted nucleotidyltransferase
MFKWRRKRSGQDNFPVIDHLDQLGCPLASYPGADACAYAQLLVGFDQILQGNDDGGFALVYNIDVNQAHMNLVIENVDRLVTEYQSLNKYWRTAILEAASRSMSKRPLLRKSLEWVRRVDPVLADALRWLKSNRSQWTCLTLQLHWETENRVGKARQLFDIEDFKQIVQINENHTQRVGATGA